MASLQDLIAAIVGAEIAADPASLDADTRLDDLPGFDSVAMAGVLLEIEDRLGVQIDRGAIEHVETVRDLAALAEPAP